MDDPVHDIVKFFIVVYALDVDGCYFPNVHELFVLVSCSSMCVVLLGERVGLA